jgi:glycosyltransferase involved in cell wall biosynthesis
VHTAISDKVKVLALTSRVTAVAFVVSGDRESAMGVRAREMASRLATDWDIRIAYRGQRKLFSVFSTFMSLTRLRPSVTYVFDISYTAVLSAALYKLIFRNRLVIETGDAITELVRTTGSRDRLGLWLTQLLESIAFRFADRVVVRGSFHKEWLSKRGIEADVIQDGVDTDRFAPQDAGELRKHYGLDGVLTVGMIGSSVWSEKLGMCYGWDLIEMLRLLKDRPVKGVMIGSGSGIARLKSLSRDYGIEDKILFLGHVLYGELPRHLNLIDICLSTQTNNLVGQVRTTGKLPLYLAAGRYILASKVGEAAIILDQEMLVDYQGTKDQNYPLRLSQRVLSVLDHPEKLECAARSIALAKTRFDYSILADRLKQILQAMAVQGARRSP